jgi:hypothetical protein
VEENSYSGADQSMGNLRCEVQSKKEKEVKPKQYEIKNRNNDTATAGN